MFQQLTLWDTDSAISSPGSVDGLMPSNSRDGQPIAKFGQDLVPVNRSPRLASEKAKPTKDTSGQSSFGLSESVGLKSSSESKSPDQSQSGDPSVRLRLCKQCSIEKPFSEFYANSKGNYRKRCKACTRHASREHRSANRGQTSAANKAWRSKKRGHALVNIARHRAKSRGMPCELVPEEIQAIIDNGICELTGIAFDLNTPRAWNAPSLDRINSSEGYTKENTRVVLYALNVAANTWGENRILEIASAISKRRKERSNSLSIALGERLKESLSGLGSPEYAMTWSQQVTPCGHVFYRLAASGHRTSGNDCSGWPTPTCQNAEAGPNPRGNVGEHFTLQTAAMLTGLATPQRHDAQGGKTEAQIQAMREKTNAGVSNLNEQCHLVGWPTPKAKDPREWSPNAPKESASGHGLRAIAQMAGWPTPTAQDNDQLAGEYKNSKSGTTLGGAARLSTAAMANRGVLAAEFSRWLMGYPATWDDMSPNYEAWQSVQDRIALGD